MESPPERYRYEEYPVDGSRMYGEFDEGGQGYSPESHDRRDKERTRDRERRRERRRRERERDRDRDRDRERDRDYVDRERSRDRNGPRESRFSDVDDRPSREHRSGSREEDSGVYDYGHGEGFYEEGGYIDHPGHSGGGPVDDDYNSRGRRDHRDYDRDRERQHGGNNWMTDTPTHTILLRGLPQQVDEKDIKAELMLFGAPIKDVRLMKRKDTGASRGFAFVEFQKLTDSQRWMDHNQGRLKLLNQFKVSMHYSMPKTGRTGEPPPHEQRQDWLRTDWTCSKCGYHNFKRRDHCFKCNIGREESDRAKEGDGFDQVGNNPCNTLIFRGLDALTTEENLVVGLGKVSALPVKNTQVLRDELTGTSRGFGFAEFGTLAESSQVLEVIQNMPTPFEVDGKAIIVSYAKNTFSTVMATMSQQNQYSAQSQAQPAQYDYSQYGTYDATTGHYYDSKTGQYYDPQTGQYYDYAAYYQHQQAVAGVTQTQTDSTNAAAAVAQAALQAQAAKNFGKQKGSNKKTVESPTEDRTDPIPAAEYPKYPTPDVSTYQYEESSGYYYDPSTSLYYDPNTQYYYNSTTNTFMYWDGEKQTYLPAPNQEAAASGVRQTEKGEKKDEEKGTKGKDRKEKVKIAKKIAKDMEKWAKTLNAQKEAMKEGFKRPFQGMGPQKTEKESASADAGFAILEMVKVERSMPGEIFKKKEDKQLMPPPPMPGGKSGQKPGLVASYGGDSDSDDDDVNHLGVNDEDKLLDWNKMACLLCKRQFPNKEALQRHQQLSDLHKTNLENFRKTRGPESSGSYRDRAKERRLKYGKPEPPVPKKANMTAPVPYEQPTKQGLTNDNVGNKLLQKMGWNQGQGLGKANQGMTDPVEATLRQSQAGLGTRGSSYNVQPGDTYKDAAKKTMFARYNEVE